MLEHLDKKSRRTFDNISRRAGRAITDYDMIKEGDRIMVAVSGGKDSLTLLNVMLHRQAVVPIDFEIVAIHVDSGLPGPDMAKLEAYFKSLGVTYHIERTKLFSKDDLKDLNCYWCSWNRRKTLLKYAIKAGFQKIALGHHLDDIVETIILNQFFKGELSTMCPKQDLFDGKLSLIRPLAYEREGYIVDFAKEAGLTAFETCRCPVSPTTQRAAIKKMLREFEKVTPTIVPNIFRSLKNIKQEYLP